MGWAATTPLGDSAVGQETTTARTDVFQKIGAGERTRTADLLITNQLLYQLSYAGPGEPCLCVAHSDRYDRGW